MTKGPCKCKSSRIATVSAKCSDMCFVKLGTNQKDGYVPGDMGIGGGDYVKLDLCLDCGTVQGEFPRPPTEMESPPA